MNIKLNNLKRKFFREDLIIDIGSNKIIISGLQSSLNSKQSSLIALEYKDSYRTVLATGDDAFELYGKETRNVKVECPIKKGKIIDKNLLVYLLKDLILKYNKESYLKFPPRIISIVPTNIEEVDREQLEFVINSVGCREFTMIDTLIANAIGVGCDIGNEKAIMVIDIGKDVLQCGIIKLNKIVVSKNYEFGLDFINYRIIDRIRELYHLEIGYQTAEKIKKDVGLNPNGLADDLIKITGKDILSNIPKDILIKYSDIYEVNMIFYKKLLNKIKEIFSEMPVEISSDIIERGIIVCGGGSQLANLKNILKEDLKIKIKISDNDFCAVDGVKLLLNGKKEEKIINYE